MKKKNKASKPARRTLASARIAGLGVLRLVRSGTQFHMAINDARLESVRTAGAATRMFKEAAQAMGRKRVKVTA